MIDTAAPTVKPRLTGRPSEYLAAVASWADGVRQPRPRRQGCSQRQFMARVFYAAVAIVVVAEMLICVL